MEGTAGSKDDNYTIKLEVFEGPLDLLLHLIRINEIDISDIPIVKITDQYNQYLDFMKEMNFDIAGEFLVMAATLIYIKSRTLLPSETTAGEGEKLDPRAELTRQLIDYQRFKAASENLTALDDIQRMVWIRSADAGLFIDGEELIEANIFDVVRAFKLLLDKAEARKKIEISKEEYSVQEKMAFILNLLERSSFLQFETLFSLDSPRSEKIAVFLAILELIRLRKIRAFQRNAEDSIKLFIGADKKTAAQERH